MRVNELIGLLLECDPDAFVFVFDGESGYYDNARTLTPDKLINVDYAQYVKQNEYFGDDAYAHVIDAVLLEN